MTQGFCPECDSEVGLGKTPKIGQQVTCNNCGALLEIIATTPVELDWAFSNDDDFEDADEDFFEDDD